MSAGSIEKTVTADFDDWVAARGPGLLRLAYVLTGNRADAEDAVQDALSRALPRWEQIRTVGDPDAYVRRMVVNAHTSWWRKFRKREAPVAETYVRRRRPTARRTRSATRSGAPAWRCRRRNAWRSCCATTNSSSTPRSRR